MLCSRPLPKMLQRLQTLVNLAIPGDNAPSIPSDGVAPIPSDDAPLSASILTATPGGARVVVPQILRTTDFPN